MNAAMSKNGPAPFWCADQVQGGSASTVCDERIKGRNHRQIAVMVGMSVGMAMKYSRHIDQSSRPAECTERERAKPDNPKKLCRQLLENIEDNRMCTLTAS